MQTAVDGYLGVAYSSEVLYVPNSAPGVQLSRDTLRPVRANQGASLERGPSAAVVRVHTGSVAVSYTGYPLVADIDVNTSEFTDQPTISLTSSSAPLTVSGGENVKKLTFINAGTCTVQGQNEMQQVMLPESGTITLTVPSHGSSTNALTAATLTAAKLTQELELIVGADNVFVDGDVGGPFDVYFINGLANTNLLLMTTDAGYVAAGYNGSAPLLSEHAIVHVQLFREA